MFVTHQPFCTEYSPRTNANYKHLVTTMTFNKGERIITRLRWYCRNVE